MMEVKQNTAVDLNDLLTSPTNGSADEADDAVLDDLADETAPSLVDCDIIKTHEKKSAVIEEVQNGDTDMTSLIKDIDEEVVEDMSTPVNPELEDALLAEDDVLPEDSNDKSAEPKRSSADDILAEKSETSNSTTSSTNVRDPGDDLDTLLSKINDIVEDCIEKENESNSGATVELEQSIHTNEGLQQETKLNDSVLEVEEKNNTIVSNLDNVEKSNVLATDDTNGAVDNLDNNEETPRLLDIDRLVTPDLDFPLCEAEPLKSAEEDLNSEKDKSHIDEEQALLAETVTASDDTDATPAESTANKTENDINLEKTETSKEELHEADKITESSEPHSTNNINDENKSDDNTTLEEINTPIISKEEVEEVMDNTPTSNDDKMSSKEVVVSGNAENDDSDDEIVFYVDKPPEKENSIKSESSNSLNCADERNKSKEEVLTEKKTDQEDDDVVLLLDDDEDDINQSKKEPQNEKESREKNTNIPDENSIIAPRENAETKEKDIVVDNSDNARDDFAADTVTEKVKPDNKIEYAETAEETNSNCSSSSNLLQESKSTKTATDETIAEDAENDEEDDDGDVELIIGDLKEPESEKIDDSEVTPPAKRIRLSEDGEKDTNKQESGDGPDEVESSNDIDKTQAPLDVAEKESNSLSTSSTLKRSHDVIELEVEEKSNDSNERCNKKPKTDVLTEKVDFSLEDKQSEDVHKENEDKIDIKAIPSYEPIRLYPPPKLGALKSELPMSLEYLKKFRKSFDNMTKQDLEELVLQKVVEAIIHKSEFSEMRELIEKQEKLISAHRTKISELSKQFRDLEMVHNRVVKDIEQRNSQFIMPVKITRAVGLQVYIPNKKSLTETTTSAISQNIPTSPQRPISSQTSSTSNTSITPPQRQFLPTQSDTLPQRPTGASSSLTSNAGNIRRGCVQKITPIRPVPGSSQPTSSGSSAASSAAYRTTQTHAAAAQPRILNKNAAANQTSTPIQRSRYVASSSDSQRLPTQPVSRNPNMPVNSQRVAANTTSQSKSTTSVAAAPVLRRAEPPPAQTTSNATTSIVDNYLNSLTHLTGGNTAVSITPAKPKEKAVIDLTDEDDTAVQSTAAQSATQISGTQVPRRSLPTLNSSNSQIQHGRAAPTMARVPPASQMANNKNRQLSSMQAQKNTAFTSISTPPGTSITRINVAPNNTSVQRVKYSHPAPLPATPPQAFNPTWKLPPPRPTIRISNLDNGIVISWTMEESMDRHAECVSYQIYAYQETSGPPMVDSWRHVGDVKAMLLPMAVTLTQFQEGQRYYFAVRAVDCHQRYGPFSLPKTWS